MENRFIMTYARSRPSSIVPYAEENGIGLMTNAAHRWSDATDQFLDLWDYDTFHVVDSGGYNVQANHGEYPWTVSEYHQWLSQQSFDWAAVMDYACEERFDDLHSVRGRQKKTLVNTLEHFGEDPEYKILPVLQGRSVQDYVEFYDLLVEHGIPTEHVGLGTVCRISSEKEIVETERKIRDQCKNVDRIHGFGVKLDAYRMGATFDTADSQAWVYAASNGSCYEYDRENDSLQTVPMSDDSKKRTVESFKAYHEHANRLLQRSHSEVPARV